MGLSAYPAYVESEVEWLGTIPKGWRVGKFRHLFIESAETNGTIPVGDMLSVSGYRGIETKEYDDENRKRSDADLETYRVVRVGQLAVNTMWLNYAGLGVSTFEGHMSPAYRAYWIRPQLFGRYAHHLLRSSIYVNAYTGHLTGVRPNSLQMNRNTLMGWPIVVPPLVEQAQISDYLDRETGQIDALIAQQEQLVETLTERRQAVIAQAVTRGLDPTVEFKESEVPWFGRIPTHWLTPKVSLHFDVTLGKMLDVKRPHHSDDVLLPYVRAGNVHEAGLDLDDLNEMPFSPEEASSLTLRRGDLLVVEGGAVGVNQYLEDDLSGVSFQKTVNRVRPLDQASARFLGFVLDVIRYRGVIDMLCNKSTIAHLTADKLERIVFPQPPVDEQEKIVAHLREATARTDALIDKAGEVVEVLRERRQALINSAVTGKIDVRGL
ncbi:restriction endonuclease subunit S [Cryobacterium breve]|nr:restriction endonuclease subunit S [Cryobacterium breve]